MNNPFGRWLTIVIYLVMLPATVSWGEVYGASKILRNIAYGSNRLQKMDIYLPQQTSNVPVIVMIHGGAWQFGDKTNARVIRNKVARWVPRGFAFISLNYRLLGEANPVQQAEDVARALAKIQTNAKTWGLDNSRILIMGHSSGAHLAALLASSAQMTTSFGVKPWLGTILIDTAAFDISEILSGAHHRLYGEAFGNEPEFWRAASPLHALSTAPAPLLIICSTHRLRPCPAAKPFIAKAKSMGATAKLLRVSLNHRQLNQHLGLPNAYTKNVEAFISSLTPSFANLLNAP